MLLECYVLRLIALKNLSFLDDVSFIIHIVIL